MENPYNMIEATNKSRSESDRRMAMIRQEYMQDIKEILNTDYGIGFFAILLYDLGYFSDVYTNNSLIYKNAALQDFARQLMERIDSLNLDWMVKIKKALLDKKNRKIGEE